MPNERGLVHKRISANTVLTPSAPPSDGLSSPDTLISIPLSELVPDPYQARHDFSNLEELKESIKRHTQLEPIIVIQRSDGKYIIKNGERRYRAMKLLAQEAKQDLAQVTITAICKGGTIDDFLGVIGNMIREGYSPFEIALLLKNIKEKRGKITDEQIGEYIGKSRNLVTEYLSLLRLPKEIQERELERSVIPFNKLKQLAVGANESNKEEKISEYERLLPKYITEEVQVNTGLMTTPNNTHNVEQTSNTLYTKQFITISHKIDATIKGIERFKLKPETTPEEKQALVNKLDEVIAKAQAKKAAIASEI